MTEPRLNATAASLLGFLHDRPMSGYELAAAAEQSIGDFWTLTRSQVYRELAWMTDAGLVVPGERGARDRVPYAITEAGRAAFARWVDRAPGPETIRHPLLLTLHFGRHLEPGRLAGFLRAYRAASEGRLRGYEAAAQDGDGSAAIDPYRDATLAFGIAYERAVLGWLDRLPAAMTRPPSEPRD